MAAIDASSPDFMQIDREMANLKRQIAYYKHHRSLLTSTLLSHLKPANAASQPKLRGRIAKQHRQTLESAYRLGAGITSIHVSDPDPHAVDSGRVLGIRIEVFNPRKAAYDTPSYIFLNRPDGAGGAMRVHRHTIPPWVGLKGIAARWLPAAHAEDAREKQDIVRFARAVRAELAAAMKRRGVVEKLADQLEQVGRSAALENVKASDVEAREVQLVWRDGAVARTKLARDGHVEGVYVAAKDGRRLKHVEKAITGGSGHVDGVVQRLLESAPAERMRIL